MSFTSKINDTILNMTKTLNIQVLSKVHSVQMYVYDENRVKREIKGLQNDIWLVDFRVLNEAAKCKMSTHTPSE